MSRSRDGTPIAFDCAGDGRPVILLGGAFQQRSFDPRIGNWPAFAHHFAVHRYYRRGRVERGGTPPYTVEREIEDLDALVSDAGGSAAVYGEPPVEPGARGGGAGLWWSCSPPADCWPTTWSTSTSCGYTR